jgi:hypothetical protein
MKNFKHLSSQLVLFVLFGLSFSSSSDSDSAINNSEESDDAGQKPLFERGSTWDLSVTQTREAKGDGTAQ